MTDQQDSRARSDDRWVLPPVARIAPLADAETGRVARLTLALIRRRSGAHTDFAVFRTLARLGSVFVAHSVFLSQILLRGRISPVHKELVILQVAWRVGCAYEWAHHSHLAAALGVEPTRIEAVSTADPQVDDVELQAYLDAAAILVDRGHLDADEWARVAAATSPDQALELCMLVGHYVMVAMTIKSAGVQLEPEFIPTLAKARS